MKIASFIIGELIVILFWVIGCDYGTLFQMLGFVFFFGYNIMTIEWFVDYLTSKGVLK